MLVIIGILTGVFGYSFLKYFLTNNNIDNKIIMNREKLNRIISDISKYKNKIDYLTVMQESVNDKLCSLVIKKVRQICDSYKKFNTTSIKQINRVINYSAGDNEELKAKILNNIESLVDIEEIKNVNDETSSDDSYEGDSTEDSISGNDVADADNDVENDADNSVENGDENDADNSVENGDENDADNSVENGDENDDENDAEDDVANDAENDAEDDVANDAETDTAVDDEGDVKDEPSMFERFMQEITPLKYLKMD